MRAALTGFAAGVIVAHGLPAAPFAGVIAAAGAVLLAWRRWRFAAALAVGAGWGWLAVEAASPGHVGPCPAALDLDVYIAGLPTRQGPTLSFQAVLAAPAGCGLARGDRVRLSWMEAEVPLPRPGQRWALTARVRPARGTVNPHAFDYERWLTRQRIAATGHVVAGVLAADHRAAVGDLRLRLREQVEAAGLAHGGMVLALATGDGGLLPPAAWARLRDTATVHLFVISGLHIGMFAALGMAFGNLIIRATPLTRRFRARGIAAGFAIVAALAYATLAGWTLPVTRAATMASIAALAAGGGRRVAASTGFAAALALVLAIDPLAPLDTGFWLSFLAVGALLAFFAPRGGAVRADAASAPRRLDLWRRGLAARVGAVVLAQAVVSVAFAPALGAFVGHFHPLSPLTNLALIPMVTLAAAPLSVGGALLLPWLPALGGPLLAAADATLGLVWAIVELAAAAPTVNVDPRPATLAAAGALALAFLLPWRWGSRAAIAAASFLVMSRAPTPPGSGFEVASLDVGQGTAVLVRTARHALLYDAGARYPSGFDVGDAIVTPFVRGAHGRDVTLLVLSHADIDHVGGAAAVLRNLAVRGVSAGEPVPGISAPACRRGDAWLWHGVRFRTLAPDGPAAGNDASCVIEISHGERRALLTGDIEGGAEATLPVRPVDLLIAPHHGSRTSSTRSFVRRARPRIVIVSAGHDNHFGHPHPAVVERYRAAGAHIASTAELGAIIWRSTAPERLLVGRDDWRHWRRDRVQMAQ